MKELWHFPGLNEIYQIITNSRTLWTVVMAYSKTVKTFDFLCVSTYAYSGHFLMIPSGLPPEEVNSDWIRVEIVFLPSNVVPSLIALSLLFFENI